MHRRSAVGTVVGTAAGSVVGTAAGSAVGSATGSAVGSATGSATGSAVGSATGSAVGSATVLGSARSAPETVQPPPPQEAPATPTAAEIVMSPDEALQVLA